MESTRRAAAIAAAVAFAAASLSFGRNTDPSPPPTPTPTPTATASPLPSPTGTPFVTSPTPRPADRSKNWLDWNVYGIADPRIAESYDWRFKLDGSQYSFPLTFVACAIDIETGHVFCTADFPDLCKIFTPPCPSLRPCSMYGFHKLRVVQRGYGTEAVTNSVSFDYEPTGIRVLTME